MAVTPLAAGGIRVSPRPIATTTRRHADQDNGTSRARERPQQSGLEISRPETLARTQAVADRQVLPGRLARGRPPCRPAGPPPSLRRRTRRRRHPPRRRAVAPPARPPPALPRGRA